MENGGWEIASEECDAYKQLWQLIDQVLRMNAPFLWLPRNPDEIDDVSCTRSYSNWIDLCK
jgi:hypothetical protein